MTSLSKSARGVDPATVRDLALALPGVVGSLTQRGISFKAKGKLLACKAIHRSAEPDTLLVRVPAVDRDRLIGAQPDRYYMTPHYLPYESVLVRLAKVDRAGLAALLGLAWNFVTTPAARQRTSKSKR
jgi:hypothetical protein